MVNNTLEVFPTMLYPVFASLSLREKCPNTPYLSVFSPNMRKYGLEKTPHVDTFHEVCSDLCSLYWEIPHVVADNAT